MSRRIAVYGGAFDPFHLGHLVPTVRAQETFHFDAVYFVPSGNPPHRALEHMTPVTHRLAMVAMATLPYESFFAADDEVFATGYTYTVETLKLYRNRFPGDVLYFLLGSDSFSQIASWERWQELVDLGHLVVLHRAHMWGELLETKVPPSLLPRMKLIVPFEHVPDPADHTIYLLDHEPFPISGTSIRARQARGLPIRELVPHEVFSYILKYGLYQPATAGDDHAGA